MRKKLIAGNWKMFTTASTGEQLAAAIARELKSETKVTVAVCPPFPFLEKVGKALQGSSVALGAQNCYPEREGAFTGEVSPGMLLDVGCKYVILGHSERRQILGENDAFINRKVHAALDAGLGVILCVGETLLEREANRQEEVFQSQLDRCLEGLKPDQLARLAVAYEPVWAIGTGRTATPEIAQAAHAFIRQHVAKKCGAEIAGKMIIQYGGSVKPDNAATLMKQPDIDGALVGGASLKVNDFLAIVRAAI